MTYYLAVIQYGLKKNPLFKDFENSLQPGAKKFESDRGFIGSLTYASQRLIPEYGRSFIICDLEEGFEGVDTRFFLNTESAIFEIPDKLIVIVDYDREVYHGKIFERAGSVDEMLECYIELVKTKPKEVLLEKLSESGFKKRFVGFGERRTGPIDVAIGIETPVIKVIGDSYCIDTTLAHGPFLLELD